MNTLYLMQGIPASGKSTVAQAIALTSEKSIILSTDEFWYDENGRYVYVADHAGQAHAWNQRRCVSALLSGEYDTIIIDNTNTTQKEADPYIALAKMYGYEVSVIRVQVPWEVCWERNQQRPADRIVPYDAMRRYWSRIEVINV